MVRRRRKLVVLGAIGLIGAVIFLYVEFVSRPEMWLIANEDVTVWNLPSDQISSIAVGKISKGQRVRLIRCYPVDKTSWDYAVALDNGQTTYVHAGDVEVGQEDKSNPAQLAPLDARCFN